MAQARRPKANIWDDIWKQAKNAAKRGNKELAAQLSAKAQKAADDAAKNAKGKAALIREWDRKLGADYYINRDITSAKTRGQKAAYESRKRGFESKTKGVGARQQANPSKAIDAAAARQQKRADWVKAGGRNAPQNAAGRRTKAEQARKIVRQESTAASRAASRQRMKNKINRARGPR
jgi:hypothetical protein